MKIIKVFITLIICFCVTLLMTEVILKTEINEIYFEKNFVLNSKLKYDMSNSFQKQDIKQKIVTVYSNRQSSINTNLKNACICRKSKCENIVIAVLDSGIDYNNIEFRNLIWSNPYPGKFEYMNDVNGWDFVNNDNDPLDDRGHGTMVTGIIAATFNEQRIVCDEPIIKIMPLKVSDESDYLNYDNIIKAIKYARENEARIINMSFGDYLGNEELKKEMILSKDILFVTAAGNETNDNDINPYYPSSYKLTNNISVTSIDEDGSLSSFSNYGSTSVDIATQGTYINTTKLGGGYTQVSGTSFAAPFVTAVAAALISNNPKLTPEQIKDRILKNAYELPSLKDKVLIDGILDAEAVLNTENWRKEMVNGLE